MPLLRRLCPQRHSPSAYSMVRPYNTNSVSSSSFPPCHSHPSDLLLFGSQGYRYPCMEEDCQSTFRCRKSASDHHKLTRHRSLPSRWTKVEREAQLAEKNICYQRARAELIGKIVGGKSAWDNAWPTELPEYTNFMKRRPTRASPTIPSTHANVPSTSPIIPLSAPQPEAVQPSRSPRRRSRFQPYLRAAKPHIPEVDLSLSSDEFYLQARGLAMYQSESLGRTPLSPVSSPEYSSSSSSTSSDTGYSSAGSLLSSASSSASDFSSDGSHPYPPPSSSSISSPRTFSSSSSVSSSEPEYPVTRHTLFPASNYTTLPSASSHIPISPPVITIAPPLPNDSWSYPDPSDVPSSPRSVKEQDLDLRGLLDVHNPAEWTTYNVPSAQDGDSPKLLTQVPLVRPEIQPLHLPAEPEMPPMLSNDLLDSPQDIAHSYGMVSPRCYPGLEMDAVYLDNLPVIEAPKPRHAAADLPKIEDSLDDMWQYAQSYWSYLDDFQGSMKPQCL